MEGRWPLSQSNWSRGSIRVKNARFGRSKPSGSSSKNELLFVSKFKKGELHVDKGATVLIEGNRSEHLYTVLDGWGFRYKLLHDGRRQILNYVVPGDLIGLQASLMGEMQHSVEALSPMLLCIFERDEVHTLYRNHPGLAFDITWLASREEQMLDENLLSIGRRTALERAAYLISFIWTRAEKVKLIWADARIPLTQLHVADTLGLSLVHTNKTLRKLVSRRLIYLARRRLRGARHQGAETSGALERPRRGKAPVRVSSA